MKSLRCLPIARAALGEPIEQRGGEHFYRCPNHNDQHPSLQINDRKNGWLCGPCNKSGNAWALAAFLAKLDRSDKAGVTAWFRERGLLRPPSRRAVLTVEGLANHKALPIQFLIDLGLLNHARGVQITYCLADRSPAPRQRIRTSVTAKKGSTWIAAPGGIVPYGLWRLEEARKAGYLVIAEGESDSWTLWFHGFPCLGIPGANMASKLQAEHLVGIHRIFVIREPGDGGEAFIAGVGKRLQEINWTGEASCVSLQGAKDPNDLHKQDPDGFKEAFQKSLDIAERLPEPSPSGSSDMNASSLPYRASGHGLIWHKPTTQGEIQVPLTNFTARIISDITMDDGAEERHAFEVEATFHGQTVQFKVSAGEFAEMRWVSDRLGACGIVYPGIGLRDHARAAIQLLSGDVSRRKVYGHIGWTKLNGSWAYLHAGGAIGGNGLITDVEVDVPELRRYSLPAPPTGERLITVITASLSVLRVAPALVSLPLYASAWRAVLGPADFSGHIVGATGEGKTELAAIIQQHFGGEMNSRNLPASWSSTANSNEALGFHAKDALLVVDDFSPTGTISDIQRSHRDADRLIRAQGNSSGRQRMRPDGSLRPLKIPRGLILSTGEDVPKGQSVRARTFTLEVGPDTVDWEALTSCQACAADGLFAEAMSGFLKWLAPRYDDVQRRMRRDLAELRQKAILTGTHRRTPEIVANLALGLRYFLRFAHDAGAMTQDFANSLWVDWWATLGEMAAAQNQHQAASEPARRFLELLNAAVTAGNAHIAGPQGSEPTNPRAWGWREVVVGIGENERSEWRPQGRRVGWVGGLDLYLDADAAYAAAQELGRSLGDNVALTPTALHKRLHERGLLQSTDESRETLKVRETLEGRRRPVLHLRSDCMGIETDRTEKGVASIDEASAAGGTCSIARSGSPKQQDGIASELNPICAIGCAPMVGSVGSLRTKEDDVRDCDNKVSQARERGNAQAVYSTNNPTTNPTNKEEIWESESS